MLNLIKITDTFDTEDAELNFRTETSNCRNAHNRQNDRNGCCANDNVCNKIADTTVDYSITDNEMYENRHNSNVRRNDNALFTDIYTNQYTFNQDSREEITRGLDVERGFVVMTKPHKVITLPVKNLHDDSTMGSKPEVEDIFFFRDVFIFVFMLLGLAFGAIFVITNVLDHSIL
mmetsp:Transcript_2426/g.3405  ORF Transcript_2426/g.3405 Transcript_2426/m.3405 type:complete len:175 (+) Transcript_2426:197-721(+)